MKKIITFCFLFFISNVSMAAFSLYPFYIEFDANSAKINDQIRMTNTTNETKDYQFEIINYIQKEDGRYEKIEDEKGSVFLAEPYLNFSPRTTTIGPRQSQMIRIQRRPIIGAKDGEYVSHFLIKEMPPQKKEKSNNNDTLNISLKALYNVTIPVMINKGNVFSDASIGKREIIQKDDGKFLNVEILRSGNQSFFGTLKIKDGNEEIAKITDFRIFTSTPKRNLHIKIDGNISENTKLELINERNGEVIEETSI